MDHHDDWILFRLHRLKPSRFESLCFALLKATGHTEIRTWGAAGSESGVDLLSAGPDGKLWVTQCKRTLNLSPSRARPELEKVFGNLPTPPPEVYRLAATCAISRKTEEELEDLAVKETKKGKPTIEIAASWTETHLIAFLRDDFQELRKEFIGPLGPLPFWNVPRRTGYFTGREDLLETLEERIEAAGAAALTQAIVGLGGIGKSQTAIEYCRRHRSRYDAGVFWVDASTPATLLAGYASCAQGLALAPLGMPEEEVVAAFRRYLTSRPQWLVVLDNADEPSEIRHLLPTDAHGHVLVTTRDQTPDLGYGSPLRVGCLPIDQAAEFLLRRAHRHQEVQPEAEELAEALGGLPLALEQAGAFLACNPSIQISVYLATLQKQKTTFLEQQRPGQGNYEGTVATTWEISFRKVEEIAPAAVQALRAFAFLDPEGIPLRLCLIGGSALGAALGELVAHEDPIEIHRHLVKPLSQYSLAKFDPEQENFSVHRLVQEVIRWRLGSRSQSVLNRVYEALDVCFPDDPQSPTSWEESACLLPHVQTSSILRSESSGPTLLWLRAGAYALSSGKASQVLNLHKAALVVNRRTLGDAHPVTLMSMDSLAGNLRALGNARGAQALYETALELNRRVHGDEHPSTLGSMNNLAANLGTLGDFQGAKELNEAVLEKSRRVLGDVHPNTLSSMNNLAANLNALGDAEGARELFREALKGSCLALGEDHRNTLISMNNLAESLRALGDAQGARKLHEAALEGCRRVLGDDHPDTLISIDNLAVTLRVLGDVKGARQLHEAALEGCRRVFGDDHPDTLKVMTNLAEVLFDLGDLQEARALHEGVLEVRCRVLGIDHPDTLSSMNSLAEIREAIASTVRSKKFTWLLTVPQWLMRFIRQLLRFAIVCHGGLVFMSMDLWSVAD